jgi:hypothetical protein
MKLHPNLAGSLRFYFGLVRALCMVLAAFWLLTLILTPWIQKLFVDDPKLMVTIGEVILRTDPSAVTLQSAPAPAGSLALSTLTGTLQMDLISKDAALISAIRWTIFPSTAVFIAFAWTFFGSLRNICANLEKGQVFTGENLQWIRRSGIALLAYAGASLIVGLWATHVMNGYLSHVAVAGLPVASHLASEGALRFLLPAGLLGIEPCVVAGGLVLLIGRAFRQGLDLKNENDLTV